MKRILALLSFTLVVSLYTHTAVARSAGGPGKSVWLTPVRAWGAPPQVAQAKQPQWKSREEYDAFQVMATEKDPQKRISQAEAFLQKYANTDFKDLVYFTMMQTYQQLGDGAKAIDAGYKALDANPDNLDVLTLSGYLFPFGFKGDDPDAATKLSRAESAAKHGLEVLQKLQKPANVTDEQFNQGVKARRAIFNGTVGFVALQRKDYAAAITSFKAAAEDNPSDVYVFYRLGLAYLSTDPRDYDHGVWNLARSVALAKAGQNPAGTEIEKYLTRVYVGYHGNEEGLSNIVAQAAASAAVPEGFKVAPMETPKATGNPSVDAFNTMAMPLRLGGERAQKTWDGFKGQSVELAGFIDGVEKGTEAGAYLIHIDLLDQSKAADGVYDIELKDSTQPNVKNLSKGDPVRFKGMFAAYNVTPNFVLTLDNGTINADDIPDQPKAKPKPKPKPKPAPARRPVRRAPR